MERIRGSGNEMYHWLNYSPSHTPWQLNFIFFFPPSCSSWSSFWSATMTFWPWTTWRTCWTPSQRSSLPSPLGPKRPSTPNGPTHKRRLRPPGCACWRGLLPIRSEQNQTGHGGDGTEAALVSNWIGSGPWADSAVSGEKIKTDDILLRVNMWKNTHVKVLTCREGCLHACTLHVVWCSHAANVVSSSVGVP